MKRAKNLIGICFAHIKPERFYANNLHFANTHLFQEKSFRNIGPLSSSNKRRSYDCEGTTHLNHLLLKKDEEFIECNHEL